MTEKNKVICSGEMRHYFDANKYERCPICGAGVLCKAEEQEVNHLAGANQVMSPKVEGRWHFTKKKGKSENEHQAEVILPQKTSKNFDSDEQSMMREHVSMSNVEIEHAKVYGESEESMNSEKDQLTVIESANHIEKKAGDFLGKTVGFWGEFEENNSIEKHSAEPCVGWLVCVAGPLKGRTFEIVCGRNTVGRSHNNSICLDGDGSVSRDTQATILFDPVNSEYFIQPGNESAYTYLRGKMLIQSEQLFSRDEVCFGKGKYWFISLCNDYFSWKDIK